MGQTFTTEIDGKEILSTSHTVFLKRSTKALKKTLMTFRESVCNTYHN